MSSPFPGMDPYLEAPDLWPDFHDALAGEMRRELNRVLPRPYYARLEMRPEIGIVGSDLPGRIIPDVAIVRSRTPATAAASGGGVAVLEGPRIASSPSFWLRLPNEPLRHHFVEIRDASRGHALVTLIEIASPSNKRPGPDRRAYEAKREEILDSDTSLVEIDLLRGGRPLIGPTMVMEAAAGMDPRPDYLVAVTRAWQQGAELQYQLFPIRLEESLPCILVPLREGEAEPPLDLQYAFQQAYDGGPYARGAVDYDGPPEPPLRADLADWLQDCLKRVRTRS